MCQNEGFSCKPKLFPFLCMIYSMVFSLTSQLSFFLCLVQYRELTVCDSRAVLEFLLVCSVALGQLKISRFGLSKTASKPKLLTSSEVFQCLLSPLRLYSLIFAVLLENYLFFVEKQLRNTEDGIQCVHLFGFSECPGAVTYSFVPAK